MATDPSYDYPAFVPVPKCWRCHTVLNRVMKFCSDCGADLSLAAQPVDNSGPQPISRQPTMRGTVIDQGVPTWPPPAANLTPASHTARSDELFQRPNFSVVKSHPVETRLQQQRRPSDDTANLFKRLNDEQRAGHGMFKPSGPLPPEPMAGASGARIPPPRPPAPPALATPREPSSRPLAPADLSAQIDALPDWLAGASVKQPAVQPTPHYTTPNHLRDAPGERRSGPVDGTKADPLYASDPTLRRIPIPNLPEPGQPPKPEPQYPPFPDGKVACSVCHGSGLRYDIWERQGRKGFDIPACSAPGCERGRVRPVPDIPQPAPAADVTGPTAMALEVVKVEPVQPQITDPIEAIVEETEGPRRHLEDLIEEVSECMTGVVAQVGNCVTRLDRQRERLADTVQRLEYLDSAELMVLGMTDDAAKKVIGALRKAEQAAKEASHYLCLSDMGLDVGLLHATAWQETFGNKKGA